jgi:O-acetyl-ADP-ribose deacetylase (regulator of RNase III)
MNDEIIAQLTERVAFLEKQIRLCLKENGHLADGNNCTLIRLKEALKNRMIEFEKGDIFADDAEALVNPVNCFGVMGKGLALEFKQRFPKNFKAYELYCELRYLGPGGIFTHEENGRLIINAATKYHWRYPSSIQAVGACLQNIRNSIKLNEVKSIAIPALGCGLGGLDWNKVKPLFEETLGDIEDCRITVYEPE